MASALSVYAVPFDRLRAVPGSRDLGLIEHIRRDYWRAAEIDAAIADTNAHEDEEDRIHGSFFDAVARFVRGEPIDEKDGWLYAHVLEAVCGTVGVRLDDADIHITQPGRLDEVLKKSRAGVRVESLGFRGPPVPLPVPLDSPFVGYWTPAEVTAATAALDVADLSWADPFLVECVSQIRDWFAELAPGEGLVGFVS